MEEEKLDTKIAMNAMSYIPEPSRDAQEIVALKKESGRITGYQLSNGQVLDVEQAVKEAKAGNIKGVGVATNQGYEYLKSLPDESEDNNLDSLPTIS